MNKRRWIEQVRQAMDRPAIDVQVEASLAQRGILGELEKQGIVPTVENPNPYDPVTQTTEHDQWWRT